MTLDIFNHQSPKLVDIYIDSIKYKLKYKKEKLNGI